MPQSDFSKDQVQQLSSAGEVEFLESPVKRPVQELAKIAANADIIGIDPDNFGGFEGAKEKVTHLLELLPKVKAITLSTTSFGWIDLNYCKKRNIPVSNIPGYSRESVAEHALALLLCLAKRIIISDRQIQKNKFKLEKGIELRGKILGIIGLGNIGSRVAELGNGIGMKVIAYNHSPTQQTGIEMKSLEEILKNSDAISLHVTHTDQNKNLIGRKELDKMKNGVIVVNLVDRDIVDEQAMSEALKSGKVSSYAYEGTDLINAPLTKIENAIGLRGFGWYTNESIQNLYQIWTDNLIAAANNQLKNVVNS